MEDFGLDIGWIDYVQPHAVDGAVDRCEFPSVHDIIVDELRVLKPEKISPPLPRSAMPPVPASFTRRATPTTFEEFIDVLRPTRATVPFHLWSHLAHVVKAATARCVNATAATVTAAYIDFLLVPADYIPNVTSKNLTKTLGRSAPSPPKSRNGSAKADRHDDDKAIDRAIQLAEQGLLSRAAKALSPAKVADMNNAAVFACAQSKYPAPIAPMAYNITATTLPAFGGGDILGELKKQSNGASGGLSGWTKELLMAAIKLDKTIADDLGIMLANVVNETLPPLVQDVYRAARFTALDKEVPDAIDIRPLGIGCAVQKLLGALCFRADDPNVATWQLGLGIPYANAIIIDNTRKKLAAGKACITVDGCNAFNACSRAAAEKRLHASENSFLKQYYRFKYYQPLKLVSMTSAGPVVLTMLEGFAQGDLPSGWYFCDAITPAVDTMVVEDKKAYFDDITLIDDTDTLIAAFPNAVSQLGSVGIAVNRSKSEFYSPVPITDAQRAAITAFGLTIIEPHQAFKLLGAPISVNPLAQIPIINKKLVGTQAWFKRIRNPRIPGRLAYTLLRSCGIPKLNYLCQVVDTVTMTPYYEEFDLLQVEACEAITGIPRSHTHLFEKYSAGLVSFKQFGPELFERTAEALRTDGASALRAARLPDPDLDVSHFPQPYDTHFRSATGNHASTWMLHNSCEMSTEDFALAMQLRAAFFRRICNYCTCGFKFVGEPDLECLNHLLLCPANTYGFNGRHEEVVHTQMHCLRDFAFNVQHEPRMFSADDADSRPDYVVFLPQISPVVDFTGITNTCKTYRSMHDPALLAANAKTTKHGTAVSDKGAYVFYPIVAETSGHCHNSIDELIALLSRQLPLHKRKEFHRAFCFATSIGLQRGNARILKHAYSRLVSSVTFGTSRWQ